MLTHAVLCFVCSTDVLASYNMLKEECDYRCATVDVSLSYPAHNYRTVEGGGGRTEVDYQYDTSGAGSQPLA